MKILRKVLLGSTLILSTAVHAQPGGMFNESMAKLFGGTTAFSADIQVQMNGSDRDMTMPGKMAFDSGKSRFEVSLSDAGGKQAEQMKAMGMDKTITISRPDTKTAYMIFPGLSAYAAMPIRNQDGTKPADSLKVETTELGKDTVDGHACVKNKNVITDDQGSAHEITTWNATDLNKFPVKMEMNEQGHDITMLYKNIKTSKPDAALFEPPTDYKRYDSPQALMQQEMMKHMGGMPGGHQ